MTILFLLLLSQTPTLQPPGSSNLNGETAPNPNGNLKLLNELNLAIESSKHTDDETARGYKFGLDALRLINSGVGVIAAMQALVAIEVQLQSIVNPWADEDLRNAWDTTTEVTGIAGGIAVIIGAALPASDDAAKRALITAGGGVGLVSLLGKLILGDERGDKMKEKIAFLEMSRNAYDDLVLRLGMLNANVKANDSYRKQLEAFSAVYRSAEALTDSERAEIAARCTKENPTKQKECKEEFEAAYLRTKQGKATTQLEAYADQYLTIIHQIPEYVQALQLSAEKYSEALSKTRTVRSKKEGGQEDPKLITSLTNMKDKLEEFQKRYSADVAPFLSCDTLLVAGIRGKLSEQVNTCGGSTKSTQADTKPR